MRKYFIGHGTCSGSKAVEKHLWNYIRDNYNNCVVTEDGIDKVVEELKEEQRTYLQSHRGQEVTIDTHKGWQYQGQEVRYISAGAVSMTLTLINKEL